MTKGFSSQEAQDEFTRQCHPQRPPTLRSVLVLFSEGGLEIFGIVDGRGGEQYMVQHQSLFTIYENAPFAHAFHEAAIGDLVFFSDTIYLVAGHDAEVIPDYSTCNAALEIDQTVRQAIQGMAVRHNELILVLKQQRERLDDDCDTVQKAKRHHIYLFEQDRWLTKESQEQKRLEEQLHALCQERGSRNIGRLGACYEHELKWLEALEIEVAAGVKREIQRQTPLRKRRPAVIFADEQAREEKRRERAVQKKHEEMRLLEEEARLFREAAKQTEKTGHTKRREAQASVNPKTTANKAPTSSVNINDKPTPGHGRDGLKDRKPESATLKVCPKCGVYILQHRFDDHMIRKHGAAGSKTSTIPRQTSIESHSDTKAARVPSVTKASQAEDARHTSDPHDGSKGIGFLEREEGRFGSFPGHDDYEDEAHP